MGFTIKGLNVTLGRAHILKDIDLEVRDGEFFSLLGKSGSGKSTLLKTIAGLVQEQSGEMVLGERRLHECKPQDRQVAVVFQDIRLFPNMSVNENVAYPLRVKGVSKPERTARAEELLELVQLEGFGKRRVHQLSGGQSQRVAIARALAAEPEILLLDEPFSALDENLRESMRVFIADIHRKTGVTIIMVTHNQDEAMSMSDRIAVMDEGRIIQIGTPREIYSDPVSLQVAQYLADGDILRGEVADGVFESGGVRVPCSRPAGSYDAVVRRSAVSLADDGGDGLACTVESVRYKGSLAELLLGCGGASLHTVISTERAIARGDSVLAQIAADELLFFEVGEDPDGRS